MAEGGSVLGRVDHAVVDATVFLAWVDGGAEAALGTLPPVDTT